MMHGCAWIGDEARRYALEGVSAFIYKAMANQLPPMYCAKCTEWFQFEDMSDHYHPGMTDDDVYISSITTG